MKKGPQNNKFWIEKNGAKIKGLRYGKTLILPREKRGGRVARTAKNTPPNKKKLNKNMKVMKKKWGSKMKTNGPSMGAKNARPPGPSTGKTLVSSRKTQCREKKEGGGTKANSSTTGRKKEKHMKEK